MSEPGTGRGLGPAARDTVNDLTRLMRLEAQLAAERLKAQARTMGVSAGIGAAGGLLLLYGFLFLLAACAAALAILLPWWAALLIVGVAVVLLGGSMLALAAMGFKRAAAKTSAAGDQIKEDLRWLREPSS